MKRRLHLVFLFLLLFTSTCFGQHVFCGVVIDSLSQKPVSYASIITQTSSFYCDSSGYFYLKNGLNDQVVISCIGYNRKSINFKSGSCDTVYLAPIFDELDPVVVVRDEVITKRNIHTGRLEGKSKFSVNVPVGLTLIKFFPNPEPGKKFIINDLHLRLSQSADAYEPRKIRIRVLEAKDGKLVEKDLLRSPEVFIVEKVSNQIVSVNLKKFFLQMPESGCFVGIEFIRSGFDNNPYPKEYSGFLALKGWLSKSYDDGFVYAKYNTEYFYEYRFGSSQKINLYWALTLKELKVKKQDSREGQSIH